MDEIIKGRYNYNQILSHRQKIDLCKSMLENDGYDNIIDTQIDENAPKMEYPYPDIIAEGRMDLDKGSISGSINGKKIKIAV